MVVRFHCVLAATVAALATLSACTLPAAITTPGPKPVERPPSWAAPQVLVPASSFHGVHGLAIDAQGRLLAGTVVGNNMWQVDRRTGDAKVFIAAPEGQSDDIAVGPKGELAWTSYLQGLVRYRESDAAPIRVLAKDLPGINSIDFDRRTGKLYASQVFLGDALWEIDVAGVAAPRLIAKDLGGFNGFEVGPDGLLYGPLWFKGQVVKIDPADGRLTVLNSEFKTPAAANLDGKGHLWVIDTRTGELCRVDLASGRRSVVATLSTAIDNLAIAPDGTVYVSNMADNGIQAVDPATGRVTQVTRGKLAVPSGLKVDGGTLWVADVFGFRGVDMLTGDVRDVHRMQASELEYPFAVGLGSRTIALASWFTGTVQLLDRATQRHVEMVHGFKAPVDAIPMDDGSLLVLELGTGSLLRASGEHFKTRVVVAKDLAGPVQMILARDGAVVLTEAAGNLVRIDLATGARKVLADKLAMPEGLAQTPWGSFVVAESQARRLTEIGPAHGARRSVAEHLPIGLEPGPGMPPFYVATGVAVAADGSIYMTADRNNALLRFWPNR
ncbi:PQQ-binding-like beta-propeller repeat protein [Ideonella sp. A 288]|uniref:Vgb family protein n=1 Tax=Ideonella sp. A 288 TaxID=1962181 RepID=UPI000B4AFB71|nr:PQQ-binding-like beta-propeller repeat protein [Ideonella sp. A 288]